MMINSPLLVGNAVPPSMGVMASGLLQMSLDILVIVEISVSPVPIFMVQMPSLQKTKTGN